MLPHGFSLRGLYLGQGTLALEILVLDADLEPRISILRQIWKDRLRGRAAPLIVVALHASAASICGPAGEDRPIRRIEKNQAERLCISALAEPDRNAAIRFLEDALPRLETELPGIRNEGLLSNHELIAGVRLRPDWDHAQAAAAPILGTTGISLLRRLGFTIEKTDGITSLLRINTRDRAIAVLLDPGEIPEAAMPRFQNLSAVSWALNIADQRNLPWVVVVQDDRIRLYPVELGVGVGRRGRTETWIELRTALMRQNQAGLLWLIFSADALKPSGTLGELLDSSRRFAADLAVRLRERIYGRVVPTLATGIAAARGLQTHTPTDLRLTYAMALTVLFRLLFIAYAEDRDLLPFTSNEAYQRRSVKYKAQELSSNNARPGPGARYWQELTQLFDAVRTGDPSLGVPTYGGGLFETDPTISPPGAALAAIVLPDTVFVPALRGLLLDETRDLASPGAGPVDFRSLRVGEFGTIYEGLLESELAVAEIDLALKKQGKDLVYVPAKPSETPEVRRGNIYLHNRSGARKSSGSYYTPGFVVDHLLDAALKPALQAHAQRLAALPEADAADAFFDIRIADIAMGSGHFLVAAVDVVEQALTAILADRNLPGVKAELANLQHAAETELQKLSLNGTLQIDESQLLRRLIARRCIYGVDLNPLAVDLARLSIWIHTFVPGLPLSLLDHALVQGNSLVGIATVRQIEQRFAASGMALFPVDAESLLGEAADPLKRLARLSDATPKDIEAGREAMRRARNAIEPTRALCDLMVAEKMSPEKVTFQFENWPKERARIEANPALVRARELLAGLDVLHFPVAFPEVFLRDRPGFDVILGNPPWEKMRLETHEFWARHFPGLRGIKETDARDIEILRLQKTRPDLLALETVERAGGEIFRNAMRSISGMNTGHPDLFRAFMARFAQLLAEHGGRYGVVLPGDAFKIKGNGPVREDLDHRARRVDVQMLTNRSEWVFKDVDGRKLIALVGAELADRITDESTYVFRPEYHREAQFRDRSAGSPVERGSPWLRRYSSGLVQPTLPTANALASLAVIEALMQSPRISQHPRLSVRRVYADVETSRSYKAYYKVDTAESGLWPVYGGDSFDIWQPDTGQYYAQAHGNAILQLVQEKRANAKRGSPYFETPDFWRRDERTHPCRHPRIAYRDITNRTNTRTLVAALIPPNRVLVQTAPWVLWTDLSHPIAHEAFLLGIMSSIPADWWMRRFVEGHVDEEAFASLRVPDTDPTSGLGASVVTLAGRLACPDDRFAAWAASLGVACGPLAPADKRLIIEELDAVVARLYGLTPDHLIHIFDTFHEWPDTDQARAWAERRDRTVAILRDLA
jgi:hypothetical protein